MARIMKQNDLHIEQGNYDLYQSDFTRSSNPKPPVTEVLYV